LVISFAISIFIIFIYKKTFKGVVFNKSFALSLSLLTVVTTSIIMTVTSNIALSLGMVGALSIVRFRTAVKDPVDTVFMFWAVCAGIMTGAGLYFWSVFANILMGVLYIIISSVYAKISTSPYLLTIKYTPEASSSVKKYLHMLPKYKLKAKVSTKQCIEISAEVSLNNKDMNEIESLKSIEGVIDVSVISY